MLKKESGAAAGRAKRLLPGRRSAARKKGSIHRGEHKTGREEKPSLSRRLAVRIIRWREKRGRPAFSAALLEQMRAVSPGQRPEKAAFARLTEQCRLFLLGVFAAGLLAAAAFAAHTAVLGEGGRILRPPRGEADRQVSLELQADGEKYPLELSVSPEAWRPEEYDGLFARAEEELCAAMLNGNESTEQVAHDLAFPTACSVSGLTAEWIPDDGSLLGYDGRLLREDPEEEAHTFVTLKMTLGEETRERQIGLFLIRQPETLQERFLRKMREAIAAALDAPGDSVLLPQTIEGRTVTWSEPSALSRALGIFVLGLLASFALVYTRRQRLREAVKKRNRQLELDYGELVSELTILTGAGLSLRSTWKKILENHAGRDEEEGSGRKTREPRFLYQEMTLTQNALDQGVPEENAWKEFGRRCGLGSYMRLGSLLESNVRRGTKGLNSLLQQEAQDAFRQRLQLAKRQGEEISSRLLIPMMLMFALVLVMLMVPAFMAFF